MSQKLSADTLYPWKSKSGLIGYSNQDGQVKIRPQFQDASLFSNQFAIVEKDDRKGIINKEGLTILDCQYDDIQLAALENVTLAITQKNYNAWWKVNRWKLFPGFSVMGGSGDKRIVDRTVPAVKWEITLLNNGHTFVRSDHRPIEFPYDTNNMRGRDDKFLINDQLYQYNNGQVKHLSGKYKGFLRDSSLLRNDGKSYKKMNLDLKSKADAVFKIPAQVTLNVGKKVQELKTVSRVSGVEEKFDFWEDQHAQIYIYPDLQKPFPTRLSQYPDPQTDAAEIIRGAKAIWSVPETDYFLIYSLKGFYILHRKGTWETDRAKINNFSVISNSGNVKYPSTIELDLPAFLPEKVEVKRIERTLANKHWFRVSGITKSDCTSLVGIFDTADSKWILPMEYSSLEEMRGHPYIWKFEDTYESDYKKKKYGLIDIRTGKIIIKPIYNQLNLDGKAGMYHADQWNQFYINPITGLEYREL